MFQTALAAAHQTASMRTFTDRHRKVGKLHKVIIAIVAMKLIIIANDLCKSRQK